MIPEGRIREHDVKIVDVLSEAVNRDFVGTTTISEILRKAKVDFLLVGAHALGYWTNEPRATQDLDIVVKQEDFDRAIGAIKTNFPGVDVKGNRVFNSDGKPMVDILPAEHDIYRTAIETGVDAGDVSIPNLEMMLVMKFLSSSSPLRRRDKKIQDKADFFNAAMHNEIDEKKMLELLKRADVESYELNASKMLEWVREAKE